MRFGDALRSVVFDDQRARRETAGSGMVKTLLDMGLSGPEAQSTANKFIMNGLVSLPTARAKTLVPGKDIAADADPDVPIHSTPEPISYDSRKKKRAYLLMDQGTGKHSFITPPPGMENVDDIEQLNFNSVHPATPEKEDPITALYKRIVEDYNKNAGEFDKDGNPKGVTQQQTDNFKAAASALGLPYEEPTVPRETGFLGKARNAMSAVTNNIPGLPAALKVNPAAPQFDKLPPTLISPQQKLASDVQRAKAAIKNGFVDADEAQRRLEKRWGKKDFGLTSAAGQ